MTIEKLNELRGALKMVGKVRFSGSNLVFCEGVSLGETTEAEALQALQDAWEGLQCLLPEVYKLFEDYRRLRHTAQKAAVSIMCDAPSSSELLVPVDWWQVNY